MDRVRLGIVGLGNMGSGHIGNLPHISRVELTAVCDLVEEKRSRYADPAKFESSAEMIRSGPIDAILIAVPHYDHTTIGIDALEQGLHVLVEKPISVHRADCERLIAAHRDERQVFAAMFNQRTDPHYILLRDLVQSGRLGEIQRVNWIITNWFRPESYYASGGWRATWGGEGGGVLLNQCPHNLDLLQWITGKPSRVTAFCQFGKYHDIEVEDEVTAYLEYANGATGVFVTTTGEAPGTNRLEIAGDRGKVVLEDGRLAFTETAVSVREFRQTSDQPFGAPATETVDLVPGEGKLGWGAQHTGVLQNFVDAILDGTPVVARAEEGIHSVELANAMLYSAWTGRPVDLPLDGAAYEAALKQKIAGSRHVKQVRETGPVEMSASFNG